MSPSSQLSRGAKAGIAVASVFAVVLLLVGAYLLWRRRRSFTHDINRPEGGTDKEINQNPVAQQPVFYEVDGMPRRTELEDTHAANVARAREGRSELSSNGCRIELH